ncbi:hypothetical protein J6590_057894 [Homalodisca vitripennis]|nr:hypothetical protein J6590_057894 [Homalodisca vitripennis]
MVHTRIHSTCIPLPKYNIPKPLYPLSPQHQGPDPRPKASALIDGSDVYSGCSTKTHKTEADEKRVESNDSFENPKRYLYIKVLAKLNIFSKSTIYSWAQERMNDDPDVSEVLDAEDVVWHNWKQNNWPRPLWRKFKWRYAQLFPQQCHAQPTDGSSETKLDKECGCSKMAPLHIILIMDRTGCTSRLSRSFSRPDLFGLLPFGEVEMSSAKRTDDAFDKACGRSFMYNKTGPNIEPCGIPITIGMGHHHRVMYNKTGPNIEPCGIPITIGMGHHHRVNDPSFPEW